MRLKTTGSTVTGISMFTVPTMVGVRSRRNRESRAESTVGSNGRRSDQRAEQCRPSLGERRDAEVDEGSRRAHGEDVARSDAADANRLQRGADAADGDRTEHRPGQVRFTAAGSPNHDRGDQNDAGTAQNHELLAALSGRTADFVQTTYPLAARDAELSGLPG